MSFIGTNSYFHESTILGICCKLIIVANPFQQNLDYLLSICLVLIFKGFIEADKKKVLNVGPSNLPKTKAIIDEEKMR